MHLQFASKGTCQSENISEEIHINCKHILQQIVKVDKLNPDENVYGNFVVNP